MKILVPVKRVVDYNVKVRVKSDQSGVELENVKMSMNPFDEIAIEEALRIKEKNIASEVIAISIGNTQVQETIRNALAMGADSGIFVNADNNLEPLSIAKILSSVVNKINPDIIIHLAAQAGVRYSLENPMAYIESNIIGFTNILEGCRHSSVEHLVYASSSSVYGSNTKLPFSVHDNVDHPLSLYAATKKSNELLMCFGN